MLPIERQKQILEWQMGEENITLFKIKDGEYPIKGMDFNRFNEKYITTSLLGI